jgi:hypothetical protein
MTSEDLSPKEPSDMQHHQPTTIAILGTDSPSERILALLLEDEGYDTRRIETERAGLADRILDGIDVLLLAPGLSTARHLT